MKKIAIVYHSGFGHTEVIAKAVAEGVKQLKAVDVALFKVEDVTAAPDKLNTFDAIVFGAPTYMGSASAPFKAFMDASSSLYFSRDWENKIAAGFTNSHSLSGDKLNTLFQLAVFAMQHAMIWVGQSDLNGSPDGAPGKEDAINRMGSSFGLMAQSENEAPSVTPPIGDIKTAHLFGKRIAEITLALNLSK